MACNRVSNKKCVVCDTCNVMLCVMFLRHKGKKKK